MTRGGEYTYVTIQGSNLSGATSVNFGATPANWFVVNSNTMITALAPAHDDGLVNVVVTTPAGSSSVSGATQFTYTTPPLPTITALSVSSGPAAGGTQLTLTGTNFTDVEGVYFGDLFTTDITVASSTSLVVQTPPHVAGTVDVLVSTHAGVSALAQAARFTYQVGAVPAVADLVTDTGTTAGGTVVVVTGSNFTGAGGVSFGGVPADFVVNSDTHLTAIAPAQAAGTVNVIVATPSGTSANTASDDFTYTNASAPTVTGLSLTTGTTAGGAVVTLTANQLHRGHPSSLRRCRRRLV